MNKYVLKAKPSRGSILGDGFYTGNSYIYQNCKYAVVDKDISKAKIYSSKAKAANACNKMSFENYSFTIMKEN